MKPRGLFAAILLVAWMYAGGILAETSFAQKASVPKQPNMAAIASEKVKELLAVMETDKNGKISKQEWMKFMESEFDKLDTTKKGEIDPKQILKSSVSLTHAHGSDVGK